MRYIVALLAVAITSSPWWTPFGGVPEMPTIFSPAIGIFLTAILGSLKKSLLDLKQASDMRPASWASYASLIAFIFSVAIFLIDMVGLIATIT